MSTTQQTLATLSLGFAFAACGGSPLSTTSQPLSAADLEQALARSRQVVEIHVEAGGHARKIHLTSSQEEKVMGRALSVDPAGRVVLDFAGLVVTFDDLTRFRTDQESHETRRRWVDGVAAALAAGEPVYVRATRPLASTPATPDDASFRARDLRTRAEPTETKLELEVGPENLSLAGERRTITVLNREISVDDSTEIRAGDDNGQDGAEAGDDNGQDGAEAGDDNTGGRGGRS